MQVKNFYATGKLTANNGNNPIMSLFYKGLDPISRPITDFQRLRSNSRGGRGFLPEPEPPHMTCYTCARRSSASPAPRLYYRETMESDMRCYNGAPDSQLQAKIASREAARKRLLLRGITVTYFPAEGKFLCFSEYKPIGDFQDSVELAELTLPSSQEPAAPARV